MRKYSYLDDLSHKLYSMIHILASHNLLVYYTHFRLNNCQETGLIMNILGLPGNMARFLWFILFFLSGVNSYIGPDQKFVYILARIQPLSGGYAEKSHKQPTCLSTRYFAW